MKSFIVLSVLALLLTSCYGAYGPGRGRYRNPPADCPRAGGADTLFDQNSSVKMLKAG